jgi:hypothetical protein
MTESTRRTCVLIRQLHDDRPVWRSEEEFDEWVSRVSGVDEGIMMLDPGQAFVSFLDRALANALIAGLRRLSEHASADRETLMYFAEDLQTDVDALEGDARHSDEPIGVHAWSFDDRSIWVVGNLDDVAAESIRRGVSEHEGLDVPLISSSRDRVPLFGEMGTAVIMVNALELTDEDSIASPFRGDLQKWAERGP